MSSLPFLSPKACSSWLLKCFNVFMADKYFLKRHCFSFSLNVFVLTLTRNPGV